MEKAVAMAPATLVDARALCHSRDFQRNVGPSPTMKVGLHRLRRRVHNSALADRDLFGGALDTHLYMDRVRLDRDWLIREGWCTRRLPGRGSWSGSSRHLCNFSFQIDEHETYRLAQPFGKRIWRSIG